MAQSNRQQIFFQACSNRQAVISCKIKQVYLVVLTRNKTKDLRKEVDFLDKQTQTL